MDRLFWPGDLLRHVTIQRAPSRSTVTASQNGASTFYPRHVGDLVMGWKGEHLRGELGLILKSRLRR